MSNEFYRAMHFSGKRGHAIAYHPSVSLSVTLVICDHIGCNSSKIISRLVSAGFLLSVDLQHHGSTPKGTPPNFCRNSSGVGKISDFRHLSRRISETVQDRVQVTIDH